MIYYQESSGLDFAVKFMGGNFLNWNESGVFLLHFGIWLAHFLHIQNEIEIDC